MYIRTVCALLVLAGSLTTPAMAAVKGRLPVSIFCIEARSGLVVNQENAAIVRPPASMIKMMLMFLVDEGLRAGKWTLDTPITASAKAESMGGTQIYLKAGSVWTLGDLMSGVAVASANDAAMAVAEGLWGSEAAYLEAANRRAHELGLTHTVINSVHGLPPEHDKDLDQTTARDMAVLAQWSVLSPTIRGWVGQREWTAPGKDSAHTNTNKLLWQMEGCDGLKTGYIRAAGFCVTATAERNDIRLIAVVMGCDTVAERFRVAEEVLEKAFASVERVQAVAQGDVVANMVSVDNCETPAVDLTAGEDVWVVVKKSDKDRLKIAVDVPDRIAPPVQAGAPMGEVSVALDGQALARAALVAPISLEPAGWRWKLKQSVFGWLHTGLALPQGG